MRITYPVTEFQIELSLGNFRILTIGTPDGFTVSFSLTEELSQELGEAHPNGVGLRAKTH
jgi:hypothetical protein